MIEPLTVLVSVAISLIIVLIFSPKMKDEKRKNEITRLGVDKLATKYYLLSEKLDNVAKSAAQTDAIISKGVDALATHLKLEIIPYKKQATESQILFNVVKLKKHKK